MIRKAIPAVVLIAAACGGGDRPAPAAAPPPPPPGEGAAPAPAPAGPAGVVRGIVTYSPAEAFRPCIGPIMAFVDSTSNRLRSTVGLVGSTEERGVFIIGVGATTPRNELILREVDYAVRPAPGEGCERPEQEYIIGVRGMDTTWQVMIARGAIEYRDATGSETIRFAAVSPAEAVGSSTYTTTTEFGASHSIRIVLTPGSCRDPKSGAWSPFLAAVTLDGKALQGCAWRGSQR